MENPTSLARDASNSSGRAIAEGEAAVLRWLLGHAAVGEVAEFQAKPLGGLTVWPCCDTCAGLVFQGTQPFSAPLRVLADALAVFPDGEIAGVLLWGAGGEFAWLELHDTFTEGTARRFPEVGDLRTWEQHGQSLVGAN